MPGDGCRHGECPEPRGSSGTATETPPRSGLNDVDAERQPTQDLVDELDGRPLIAGVVDLEHANAGAVVNGGELIQSLLGAGNTLEELHIQLQAKARLLLFIARPARLMWPMLLIGR